ncbi:hypothetical protein M670_00496 [Schinkia azotoformans MEV2011]|uniref:Uncharacterized protein n=1 Tax=Schinkia azotoformans MEV2011 TaxID=1348973 RepID=A0A072P4Q9_SCHAZ|nr:hypothetical protein [Schinkia azotoformans]KEF40470.1 hypothetical protein M670_00496 [Schinkia azotoformans MEV2011]MEC1696122.1 hypothetical protein [Schinkia azotoformans]MEC1716664.1 hypothetical protein [Schinkia azotoformans]MEC1725375.1 hypothetical protein [Schinkia azotoformans]MEC1739503.1 hypothetical protein [Schinkia azotoformans]
MSKKITRYNDLSETQQKNMFYLLDKTQTHQLNLLREKYQVKYGKNLNDYRDNVLHALMMEEIDFDYFCSWLSQLNIHGHNTLFIYEADNPTIFKKNNTNALYKDWSDKIVNIYDISPDNLQDLKFVNVEKNDDRNQVIFTMAAPAYIEQPQSPGNIGIPKLTKDVYLAYIIIDFELEQIILSMYPTPNLHSIMGIKRKMDMDNLAPLFINFFRKNVIKFNFSDPDWIIDTLCDITEEYYHHNNPIIDKKLQEFESGLLNDLYDKFSSKEPGLTNPAQQTRIKQNLRKLYEYELIAKYGRVDKCSPFAVFLHQSDKAGITFRATSKGKPLSFADSHEIVKKMIENADISTLGITYVSNEKNYPYKVSKTANYYSLKRITAAVTEKEIVDDVLRKLKQYKYGEETRIDTDANQDTK